MDAVKPTTSLRPVLKLTALNSVAIDIWSVGIILLCFLTRRFPFFNSNDDTEALAEIATIFGKRRMERCAALHSTWREKAALARRLLHDNRG